MTAPPAVDLGDNVTVAAATLAALSPETVSRSASAQCLLQCKKGAKETLTCPECRGVIKYSDLMSKGNLSMTGKMLRQSMVGLTTCDQHKEKRKLFCEEDKTVLCDSCLLAPEHKGHQALPLETAADKSKDKLQETLTVLKKKEEEFKMALDEVRRRETHRKEAASNLKCSVISEYGKMHRFLWDEEYQYLQGMGQESKDNLAKLEKEVEENLDKVPLEMLQDVKGTMKRNEELLLQEPELPSPGLTTWYITGSREVLLSFQRDITLDPESANPHLILSEDLKRVQYGSGPQVLPDNKERFDYVLAVLGVQTFTSGKHYWEVEVGYKTVWEVGICKDSVIRKGKLSSSEGVRTLAGCVFGNRFVLLNSHNCFQFIQPVYKVGIFLDYEKGHLAFYDVTDGCLIHSPSNTVFEGPLRPYFSFGIPKEKIIPGSLIICPINNQ
ncbi:probable E3 ubiquitin-protein ligase TRIML1 [Vombatus ursinus]|uniref:probable E3 ubiquitin-protein ligase TRIML1 n=1 Tax=Vombatus ursinus TaxID=29139 RepID=UPI000FFD7886|nr:probable E3 ubiquitin-protein ligase TRIML1 [Vombatus ursinus]